MRQNSEESRPDDNILDDALSGIFCIMSAERKCFCESHIPLVSLRKFRLLSNLKFEVGLEQNRNCMNSEPFHERFFFFNGLIKLNCCPYYFEKSFHGVSFFDSNLCKFMRILSKCVIGQCGVL